MIKKKLIFFSSKSTNCPPPPVRLFSREAVHPLLSSTNPGISILDFRLQSIYLSIYLGMYRIDLLVVCEG